MANTDAIIDREKIYTIKYPGERKATDLALYAEMDPYTGEKLWFQIPPDRAHSIKGRIGRKTSNGFTFISDGYAPGEWEFTEVTYESIKAGKNDPIIGKEEILASVADTKDLQDWYHRQFPE